MKYVVQQMVECKSIGGDDRRRHRLGRRRGAGVRSSRRPSEDRQVEVLFPSLPQGACSAAASLPSPIPEVMEMEWGTRAQFVSLETSE